VKQTLIQLLGIVLVSACLCLVYTTLFGINLMKEFESAYDEKQMDVFINAEKAKDLLDNDTAIFIDGRRPSEYEESHIANSLNITPADFAKGKPKILDGIPESFPLVVYCRDEKECDAGIRLARYISYYGFEKVMILEGGYDSWVSRGYPLESKQ
jgi:rhodanese-related sulfurtransferase